MSLLSGLTVRPRLPQDLPTLYRWLYAEPNPEWQRWDGPYFSKQRSKLSFEAYAERADVNPWNEDQQIVALGSECIGFLSRFEEAPSGGGWYELGVVIFDPQHWSSGLGTRALSLWTAATFAEKPAHLITLSTWSGNARMIRAAERVGYRECARIPEARNWDGQRWDSVKLGMLRREFESAHLAP
ncbi:GNAT family N-acetyltransferase [Deinococcus detaillensis]|uniref:GNAT family N-acetyltransferase n=1 Tax=Deinococcus detaillensis TaxID=2592048 RepID=A0A553V5U5_9DEIO|nr:GNAT family protein [Deinococcus detaillensis]TSA87829.1 GNAT family N-acetyltransferase [Deinococcus detaillensis]